MDGFKSIFTSKTFWGVIVSIISKSLLYFGYEIDSALEQSLNDLIIAVIGLGGDAFAIFGRIKATRVIGKAKDK